MDRRDAAEGDHDPQNRHEDVEGQAILSDGMIARFVVVHDADYDDIRRKALSAEEVSFIDSFE